MQIIIKYARWLGLKEGEVLRVNSTMLVMRRELGFALAPEPNDPDI
jgi:acetyltransferase